MQIVSVCPRFYSDKTPRGVNRHFQAKLAFLKLRYLQNYIADSNQLLHNDKGYQLLFVAGIKQALNKSKMADDRHLEKSKNGHISATV